MREPTEQHCVFVEIHVAIPFEVCVARDHKDLIPEFTGISDPYETPQNPELRIDTAAMNPMEAAQEIFLYLLREGYIETGGDCRQ